MYSRMSWAATSGLTLLGAQHGRGRLMRPKRASSANMMRKRLPPLAGLSSQHLESRFFKGILSRDVAFGMERTRHQLAPAMPGQKIINRAVAGFVPDGLFVGRLEIMDVQHLAGSGGSAKTIQQGPFLGQGHVFALASADRLGFERLDTVVISHVRPVSDTPITSAIAGCVIPLSRSSTI